MATALSPRNRERGAVVWHSSLVVVVAVVLLRHNIQLVAEVTLDGRQVSCLLARLEASDGIDGAEHSILHYPVLGQASLLAEPPYLLLYLLCGHSRVIIGLSDV